jgi:hypothetical protein
VLTNRDKGLSHTAKALTPPLLAFFMVSLACTRKPEPEGYRVVSYDASTHQWVILRTGTFDGKYLTKRITVICSFYKWDGHERVDGPDACHLQVGRMMIPNLFPPAGKPDEFLMIDEMPTETLSITEGQGADRVLQVFNILKYEVLPDNATRR